MWGWRSFLRFAIGVLGLCLIVGSHICICADSSPTFIVFAIENTTKNPALAWLGEGIAYSISEQIAVPGINVVDYEKRSELTYDMDLPPSVPLSRASMIRLAERAPADFLVMGSFSGTPQNLHIALRLLDLRNMVLGGEIAANGQLSMLPQMENDLAWLILSNSGVNRSYSIVEFKERIRLIPNESFACFICSLTAPNEDSRAKFLSKAVELTPDYPEARFFSGKNCFEKSDWKGAAQHLEYALKSAKRFQEAEFLLGTCYLQQNSLEMSIRSYSHFLAQKELPEVLNNLGVANLRKGDYALALQQLMSAQRLEKMSVTINVNIGLLQHLQRNDSAAKKVLEDALPANPNNGMLFYILSKVLEAQGETQAAKLAVVKSRHLGINVEQANREDPGSWARVFLEWERR
jgi:Flp pilus assembly protein TadD